MPGQNRTVLFLIDNWLVATAGMKAATRGWYLNLLLHLADKKSLPNNIEQLAGLAGVIHSGYDAFAKEFENEMLPRFRVNDKGRLVALPGCEILKNRDLFVAKRTRAGNIGVITKLAKQIKGFSKHAAAFKADIAELSNEELETLKNPATLAKFFAVYQQPSTQKQAFDLGFVAPTFLPVFERWLAYKKGRGERYKTEMSLEQCYKNLLKDSAGDPVIAQLIIDKAIGSNHAGFYPLKNGNKPPGNDKPPVSKAENLMQQKQRVQFES